MTAERSQTPGDIAKRMGTTAGADTNAYFGTVHYTGKLIEEIQEAGHWQPGMEDFATRIASSHGLIYGERALEHAQRLLPKPEFDFGEYQRLTTLAYQRFGRLAAAQFTRSLQPIWEAGISPQNYFNHVDLAAQAGGKSFARFFAMRLPDIVSVRGNIDEARAAAGFIRRLSTVHLADVFMRQIPVILETDMTIGEYTNTTVESLHDIGRDATRLGLPGMAKLSAVKGYQPELFLADASEVKQQVGEKPLKLYTYGLSQLGDAVHMYQTNIVMLRDRSGQRDKGWQEQNEESCRIYEQWIASVDPALYKTNYLELAAQKGRSAATLFALSVPTGFSARYSGVDMNKAYEAIAAFKDAVPGKVFRTTSWFAPKLTMLYNGDMSALFQTVEEIVQTRGAVEALKTVAFSAALRRKNKTIEELVSPNDIRKENGEFYDEMDTQSHEDDLFEDEEY